MACIQQSLLSIIRTLALPISLPGRLCHVTYTTYNMPSTRGCPIQAAERACRSGLEQRRNVAVDESSSINLTRETGIPNERLLLVHCVYHVEVPLPS